MLPFDDRDGYIWLDGDIVLWREAKSHVLSHALHYGSQVFEGERSNLHLKAKNMEDFREWTDILARRTKDINFMASPTK